MGVLGFRIRPPLHRSFWGDVNLDLGAFRWLSVRADQAHFPRLATSAEAQGEYRLHYYSGHAAASPITGLVWPVYWCGINWMGRQENVECVNGDLGVR